MNSTTSTSWFEQNYPTLRRFIQGILFRWFRGLAFALVCLFTLAALYIAEENYRGYRAWNDYEQETAARGAASERPADFSPSSSIPDEQNFFETPSLRPISRGSSYLSLFAEINLSYAAKPNLGDFTKDQHGDLLNAAKSFNTADLLNALKKRTAILDEISASSLRPFAHIQKQNDLFGSIFAPIYMALADLYATRAETELAARQNKLAAEDTLTLVRLAETLKERPGYAWDPRWNRSPLYRNIVQVVWEGLADRQWSDDQLKTLITALQHVDLLSEFRSSMFPNHMYFTKIVDHVRSLPWWESELAGGMGIYEQSLADSHYFDDILLAIDPAKHRIDLDQVRSARDAFDRRMKWSPLNLSGTYKPFSADEWIINQAAFSQTTIDEATLACALERYWQAHGEYPEKLDALAPQFITLVPHDVTTGETFKYQRIPNGRFLINNIGWNKTDDQGQAFKNPQADVGQADWTWQYPEK